MIDRKPTVEEIIIAAKVASGLNPNEPLSGNHPRRVRARMFSAYMLWTHRGMGLMDIRDAIGAKAHSAVGRLIQNFNATESPCRRWEIDWMEHCLRKEVERGSESLAACRDRV